MKTILPINMRGIIWQRVALSLVMILLLHTVPAGAAGFRQPASPPAPNLDELFLQARELAFNQQTTEARGILREILSHNNLYHDASILLARTYAWEGDYDRAAQLLGEVLIEAPGHDPAVVAMADVKLWAADYPRALAYLDKALAASPNDQELLYKKALVLNHMGEHTAAVVLLNQLLDINPTDPRAADLLESIQEVSIRNFLGAGYRVDLFDHRSPWHLAYAEYGRRTRHLGTLIGRINYASRYNNTGFQVEADAYPALAAGTYLYLNAGYSPHDDLFPRYRAGLEVFQRIPADWEASLGVRLLTFADNDLMILTGSISKYYKKYYFSLRPYFTMASEGPGSQSYYLTIRRYFSSPEHFLSLTLGTGFSADEDALVGGELYNIGSNKALLQYQQKVTYNWLLKAGLGYQHYNEGIWGDKYTLELGAAYFF